MAMASGQDDIAKMVATSADKCRDERFGVGERFVTHFLKEEGASYFPVSHALHMMNDVRPGSAIGYVRKAFRGRQEMADCALDYAEEADDPMLCAEVARFLDKLTRKAGREDQYRIKRCKAFLRKHGWSRSGKLNGRRDAKLQLVP